MKKSIAAVCAGLFLCSQWAIAQEQIQYPAEPSAGHKILKLDVGVWDADITMMGPTGEETSKGVETVTMLGELWTISTFEYEYMGQPAVGHGVIGFDPEMEKYVGTWHETGNPYASQMVGTYDEKSKTLTYDMTSKDPSGAESEMRIIMKYVDESTRNFEMQMKMPDTEEFMTIMSIKFTKR